MTNLSSVYLNKTHQKNKISVNASVTGTQTIDLSARQFFKYTMTGNTTFSITNALSGKYNTFLVEITNGGKYILTWPTGISVPTLNASGTDILVFTSNNGTDWKCNLVHDDTSSAQLLVIPSTPGLTSPALLATNVALTPTLTTTAYSIANAALTHSATQWQISTSNTFATTVVDTKDDTVNKTSYTVATALSINTVYYVRVRFKDSDGIYSSWSGTSSFTTTATVTGEAVYNSPGTYSWTCPAGVTSVSAVAVGGGGGGTGNYIDAGGGGLGYKNNISVTPGTSYTVVVGAGGNGVGPYLAGNAGGDSYFISNTTVKGGGGKPYAGNSSNNYGGAYVGDGGGNGGSSLGNGGGGAGGYSGNGGTRNVSNNGTGGGGGAGATIIVGGNGYGAGSGGGVGLYGQGANGTGGIYGSSDIGQASGDGGSGGQSPTTCTGGTYGGGGGAYYSGGNYQGYAGGSGAVRIMWGTNRSFPSNAA